MVAVIVVCTVAAVILGAWSASTAVEDRQAVQRSLRAVAEYGPAPTVRHQELLDTVGARVLAPVGAAVLRLARRYTPAGYVEQVKRSLVLAGNPPGLELDRFLVLKAFTVAAIPAWFVLVVVVAGIGGVLGLALAGLAAAVTFRAPDLRLQARVTQRRRAIERALPDTLDLLVISVEAGLGFEQAFERTATAVPGPLSEEARRFLQEVRMGASRADGLRALAERVQVDDVQVFVLAMLQADTFGISVARILRAQADEIRTRAHQRAQERAQQAPVKMLFPLAVCIFPALFVPVLVPAALRIFDAL